MFKGLVVNGKWQVGPKGGASKALSPLTSRH